MAYSLKKQFNRSFFTSERNIIIIYIIAALAVSLKIVFLETCDNFDCFRASHFHLINNLDLYLPYPKEYITWYNYSPFFSMLMGAFAYLPNGLAILFWNIANTLPFLIAIHLMPVETKAKVFMYWFCLVEFITAAEHVQTNANVTALIILVLVYQLREKTTLASFLFVFGSFFKIYVLTAGLFFLCFGNKKSFVLKAFMWGLLFFFLPILFVSLEQLFFLYKSWLHRMHNQSLRDSLSILGIIGKIKWVTIPQGFIMLLGTISMLLVLLKKEVYSNLQFRLLYLAATLLFTIIFNPGVESATYIIAVTGAAIWYINKERNKWQRLLIALVFIFTSLSPTELFPNYVKNNIFIPYHVKAIPCILVWVVCVYELYYFKPKMACKASNYL